MNQSEKAWWQKPLRIIQTNLQVADTARIDPEGLASQIEELGGNALVFNVGGVYAWYDTKIPYHTKSDFLPEGVDLVGQVIEACHRRNIRFIARADFSKAEDRVYMEKPHWFVKNRQNEPSISSPGRPGKWPLLMSTCINGPYQNDAVAIPVLRELMELYDVDGFFVNSFFHVPCHCEFCRAKYKEIYHCELPAEPDQVDPSWEFRCMHDAMDNVYRSVQEYSNGRVPMIFYCYPFISQNNPTDMLIAEIPNLLFQGHKNLSEPTRPGFSMRLIRSLPRKARPIGVVHSCPGLQWRHTGMPSAEHLYWTSQIPANGGQMWHSLTGVPDTIRDKRILRTVKTLNHMIMKAEPYMEDAVPVSQVAMLWVDRKSMKGWYATDGRSMEGWADALTNQQYPYEIIQARDVTPELLQQYKVLIIPEGFCYSQEIVNLVTAYSEQGGSVILEGMLPQEYPELLDLAGIEAEVYESPKLPTAYIRLEATMDNNPLRHNLEDTELVPLNGKIAYCSPKGDAEVLATLVPPFAPTDGVGTPERVSILVPFTDWPLCVTVSRNKGRVVYFPFSLSDLINEYRLSDHYQLAGNAIQMLLGEERLIKVDGSCPGLQVSCFHKEKQLVVNLVNGAGRRPMASNLPVYGIKLVVNLSELTLGGGGDEVREVQELRMLLSERSVPFQQVGNVVRFELDKLEVWESLLIEWK